MSGLRALASWSGFGPGVTATLPIAAGGGRIIAVAAVGSGQRFGGGPHNEYLNGVSDSGGNSYNLIADYEGLLGYPTNVDGDFPPWSGWRYAHLKIFEALGTLPAGGTVTADGARVDIDARPVDLYVWDGVGLTGAAAGSTNEVEQPTRIGVSTTVAAAGGLPVNITGPLASYAAASAAWGGGSLAAWYIGDTPSVYGAIDNTAAYDLTPAAATMVAWTPAPSNPHLQMQVRTYFADETTAGP